MASDLLRATSSRLSAPWIPPWNLETPRNFLDLFEDAVALHASSVAVEDAASGATATYEALDLRSRALAARLLREGAAVGEPTALHFPRGVDLIVAMIAVLRAGGSYLALDPKQPSARRCRVLQRSGARRVLCDAPLDFALPDGVSAMSTREAKATKRAQTPTPVDGESEAYRIYTSGSTGLPKGVAIPHRALAWYCATSSEYYELRPGTRLLQAAPASFDISVCEIFPPLCVGATVVVCDDAALGSASSFLRRCRESEVHVVFQATALWHEIALHLERFPDDLPPSLRLVSFGGERVLPERVAGWIRAFGRRVRLFNGYGPTETTVEVALHEITADPEGAFDEDCPIGRPAPGVEIYLVDDEMNLVPRGEVGELLISCPGIAVGYVDDPAQTALSFSPNPFGGVGARLYRTGDRARVDERGRLRFLGRADEQTKIRGMRIEPGEIEACLARLPGVDSAVVRAIDESGDPELRAWIASGDSQWKPGDLRRALLAELPSAMVPTSWVILDRLPTTVHGKIDFQALRFMEPSEVSAASSIPSSTPNDPVLAELISIWQEILRVPDVRPDDDFFALGGDSILGLRIVARAHRKGLHLQDGDLFEHRTPAALARAAQTQSNLGEAEQGEIVGEFPLTPVQRWFLLDFALEEAHHFNQSVLLKTLRPLDPALLEEAAQALLRHHDVLRTRFERAGASWTQRLGPYRRERIVATIDLRGLDEPTMRRELHRRATRLHQRHDLANGPIWTLGLFRLDGPHDRLLVAVHHLVVDAVSWNIYVRDLAIAYRRLAKGHEIDLGAKTTSYKHWAELQVELGTKSFDDHPARRRELEYWLSRPRRAPRLPIDLVASEAEIPSERNRLSSLETVTLAFDADLTEMLVRRVPPVYGTQIYEVLLTALVRATAPWFGTPEILIDQEGHGRERLPLGMSDHADLSNTAGWFTTTFPVHLDLRGVDDPVDALHAIKEQIRSIPHRGLGYYVLEHLSGDEIQAELRALPRPRITFNYLGQRDALVAGTEIFALAHERRGREKTVRGTREYLLDVDGDVVDGRLLMNWHFSRDLYRRETFETIGRRMFDELEVLIRRVLESDAAAASRKSFPLVDASPKRIERILREHDVEDILPLLPLQAGMIFHTLLEPERPIYFEQSDWRLRGPLDEPRLRRAFETLVERHDMLRTGFDLDPSAREASGDGLLQVVHRQAELPWTSLDLRGFGRVAAEQALQRVSLEDRSRGFDLAAPPLLRVLIARTGDQEHRMTWSFHHALLDGWSLALLFDELFTLYEEQSACDLPAPPPLRRLVECCVRRDEAALAAFWRRALADARPPRLAPPTKKPRIETLNLRLSVEATKRLQRGANELGVTLNTLVQGAFALLWASLHDAGEAIFGATASVRPPDAEDVERVVGPAINTLPIHVRVDSKEEASERLRRLQNRAAELRRRQAPLADVRRWARLPADRPLYDALLVYENYPTDEPLEAEQHRAGLEIGDFRGFSETEDALVLQILPGPSLEFCMSYDAERFDASMCDFLGELESLLFRLTDPADRSDSLSRLRGAGLAEKGAGERKAETAEIVDLKPKNSEASEAVIDVVRAIWERALGVREVASDDDFFALGGHSLVMIRIASHLQEAFGFEIPVRVLFEARTPRRLAQAILALNRTDVAASERPSAVSADDPAISFVQERMWLIHRIDPDDPLYLIPEAWSVRGTLHREALRCALEKLIARHDVFQTRIRADADGAPKAIQVSPAIDWRFLEVPPDEADPNLWARREIEACVAVAIDPARGPLVRARLLRLGADEHVFAWVIHHLAVDGSSLHRLYGELGQLYRAEIDGAAPDLAVPRFTYAEYALRRRERFARRGSAAPAALRRLLQDVVPLELPTDRPRTIERRRRGSDLPIEIDAALWRRVRDFARTNLATPYMVLLSAWAMLLAKCAAVEDLTIGTAVSTRTDADFDDVIGCFLNTVVIRANLSGDPTFAESVDRVRESSLTAFAHQDFPFEKLVDALQASRDPSRSPLFQVMFNLSTDDAQSMPRFPGVETEEFVFSVARAPFDLSLDLHLRGDRLVGALEYDIDLFDESTVAAWLDAYLHLVAQATADCERRLSRLGTAAGFGVEESLEIDRETISFVDRFEEIVRMEPDADAVVSADGERWSYAELELRSGAIARAIARCGPTADRRVGVILPRSLDLIAAVLGTVRSGATWVALRPNRPLAEIRRRLQTADADCVICADDAIAAACGLPRLVAAPDEEPLALRTPDPQAAAYVIFTSGTTGEPKGVAISHGALSSYAAAACRRYGAEASDRVLQFATPEFDIFVEELFVTWTAGATLVLRDEQADASLEIFEKNLRDQRISALALSTAFWQEWARRVASPTPDLRWISVGGSALDREALKTWRERLGDDAPRLLDTYGPTEATVIATVDDVTRGEPTIGRALLAGEVRILGPRLEPLPIGASGELVIGGDRLARGYLKPRPTAERFVPDPSAKRPGSRLYRTGDRARLRADGRFEFLGRVDRQVKIRGHRVELEAVEAMLRALPEADDAFAATREQEGALRLVAWLKTSASIDDASLRRRMHDEMPASHVPSVVVRVDEFPLTVQGKIDLEALPRPVIEASPTSGEGSEKLRSLRRIWSEVLEVAEIPADGDFFSLGGDSILVLRLIHRARAAGLGIEPRDVFRRPRLEDLAAAAEEREIVASPPSITSRESSEDLPPTPIQCWFLDWSASDVRRHFNQHVLLHVPSTLDLPRLQRALALVLERHDALRLRLFEDESGPRLRVLPNETARIEAVDLSDFDDDDVDAALEAETLNLQTRLHLEKGPLYRLAVFDLGRRGRRLFWCVHHLAVDGVSWSVLLRDLESAYRDKRLAASSTSFATWARALDDLRGSERARIEWEAFAATFPNPDVVSLPLDFPDGDRTLGDDRIFEARLDRIDTERLTRAAAQAGVRVDAVLLAALARTLGAWSGGRTLLVELEGHGRSALPEIDVAETVGWFTATWPHLIEPESLGEVDRSLRAVPRGGASWALAGEPLLVARPEVNFNFHGRVDRDASSSWPEADERVGADHFEAGPRLHLFDLNGEIRGGELRVDWAYGEHLHRRETVRRLADEWLEQIRRSADEL